MKNLAFDSICEKIIVGDEVDPFRLKFILKTKDVFKLSGADYFLKLGDPSHLEKMKPLDGTQLINEVQEIDKDAC